MNENDLELASIVHDLRNPLAAIVARAQLTRRILGRESEATPLRIEAALSEIQRLAGQMTRMLDDALTTTGRSARESVRSDTSVTDLAAVLAGAAEQVEQVTGQRRIHLNPADRPVTGPWDSGKIGRAIVNVLENALKYSPDGGAVVVAAHHDGSEIVVTVRDDGIGIPAADLPRLFDAYVRGSNTANRFTGTGLGLRSARQLIESQGGSIAIASVEGAGTTVTITLPRS